MYFKARNGSYKRVPQYPNALLGSLTGGMTVYYLQQDFNSNGKQKITSFKPVWLNIIHFAHARAMIGDVLTMSGVSA